MDDRSVNPYYEPAPMDPFMASLWPAIQASGSPIGAAMANPYAEGPTGSAELWDRLAAVAQFFGNALPFRGGVGGIPPSDLRLARFFRRRSPEQASQAMSSMPIDDFAPYDPRRFFAPVRTEVELTPAMRSNRFAAGSGVRPERNDLYMDRLVPPNIGSLDPRQTAREWRFLIDQVMRNTSRQ